MPGRDAESWLVVGAGAGGLAGAAVLAALGHEVTLVEAAPAVGHAASGFAWGEFSLDYGCHVLGNETAAATDLLVALAGGRVLPVSLRTAAVHAGRIQAGTELPDLTRLGARGLAALVRAAAAPASASCDTLADWLDARFGAPLARELDRVSEKMFRVSARALAPEASTIGPFRRVRVLGQDEARLLKQAPELDLRIAAGYERDPLHYYPEASRAVPARSFYPAQGGMRGFARAAEAELRRQGVEIALSSAPVSLARMRDEVVLGTADGRMRSADRLLWTGGLHALEPLVLGSQSLETRVHRVPMVVYYFAIPKAAEGPFDYVHDFDAEDLVFRASLPGRYGRGNCPEDRSYLCCEVPASRDDPVWQQPEAFAEVVFGEAVRHGVITARRPLDRLVKCMPSTYKLPRRGYGEAAAPLLEKLAGEPRIVVPAEWAFTASGTVRAVAAALKDRL